MTQRRDELIERICIVMASRMNWDYDKIAEAIADALLSRWPCIGHHHYVNGKCVSCFQNYERTREVGK